MEEKNFYFTAEKLSVGYGGKPLIRDIEIRLERGKLLTLIGPNGSGKSTILKSIAGQLKKISGSVYLGESARRRWALPVWRKNVGDADGAGPSGADDLPGCGFRREISSHRPSGASVGK